MERLPFSPEGYALAEHRWMRPCPGRRTNYVDESNYQVRKARGYSGKGGTMLLFDTQKATEFAQRTVVSMAGGQEEDGRGPESGWHMETGWLV